MSRGIVLDYKGRPQQSRVPLWLPPDLREQPVTATCRICRAEFRAGQERIYSNHVVACYRRNEDRLRAISPSVRKKGTVWDTEAVGDPEVEEHLFKVGERMRAEGRYEMRPSERANAS